MNKIRIIYCTDFSYSASSAFQKTLTSPILKNLNIEIFVLHMLSANSNMTIINHYLENLKLDLLRSEIIDQNLNSILLQPDDFKTLNATLNSGDYQIVVLGKNGIGNKNGNGSFLKNILSTPLKTNIAIISEKFKFDGEGRALISVSAENLKCLYMLNYYMYKSFSRNKTHILQVISDANLLAEQKKLIEEVTTPLFKEFRIETKYVLKEHLLEETNTFLKNEEEAFQLLIYFEQGFIQNQLIFHEQDQVFKLNHLAIFKLLNDEFIQNRAKDEYQIRLESFKKQ